MTTLVVGGGITGLAAALRLQERGHEFLLIEATDRLAGKIETEQVDGFTLEWGPHSIVSTGTALFDLAERLDLDSELVAASPAAKSRFLVHHGELVRIPTSPVSFLATPLLSWRERLRVLRELFVRSKGPADESAFAFMARRFGPAIAERFLSPFVSGIYAGDAEQLEMASAFPKIVALEREYGSVLRGLRKNRAQSARPLQRRGTFGFHGGMESVVTAAADRLGRCVRTRCVVRSLVPSSSGVRVEVDRAGAVETLAAGDVIVTAPARSTADMMQPLSAPLAEDLRAVPYASVGLLQLGVRTDDLRRFLDGFGFLARPAETTRLLGCIWSSAVFPARAPQGNALLSVFVGGAHTPEARDHDALFDDALAALHEYMGGKFEPVVRRQRWIERAIPQLNIGHAARKARILEAMAKIDRVTLAGGYMDGVSVHDCVRSGWEAADRVLRATR